MIHSSVSPNAILHITILNSDCILWLNRLGVFCLQILRLPVNHLQLVQTSFLISITLHMHRERPNRYILPRIIVLIGFTCNYSSTYPRAYRPHRCQGSSTLSIRHKKPILQLSLWYKKEIITIFSVFIARLVRLNNNLFSRYSTHPCASPSRSLKISYSCDYKMQP